jgi:ABC-2 type transport system permease protein
MLETTRFETERRLPGAVALALGFGGFAAVMILVAPGLLDQVDLEAYVEQFPPQVVAAFDFAVIGSIEGFLALQLYQFVWLLGLGAYLAYSAGGDVAGDVETGRMDTILAAPVSRGRVVTEKFLALGTPILVVNVVVLAVVAAGTALVDRPVAAADLLAVHLLSVPYLLCCGAVGTLVSVLTPRRLLAEGVAAGVVVAAFLVETVTTGTDLAWLGVLAPTRYYDPVGVLTASRYDPGGAAVLLAATVALLGLARLWFGQVDVR